MKTFLLIIIIFVIATFSFNILFSKVNAQTLTTSLLDRSVFKENQQSLVIIHPRFNDGSTNIAFYIPYGNPLTWVWQSETPAIGALPFSNYWAPTPAIGTYIAIEYFNNAQQFSCSGMSLNQCIADPHFISQFSFEITDNNAVSFDSTILHIITLVVNGTGGTAVPSDFTVHIKNAVAEIAGSPAPGAAVPGTSYALPPGTYAVSEDVNASYEQSFSGACDATGSLTLSAADDKICTIVNTNIPAPGAVAPPTNDQTTGTTPPTVVPLIGILGVPSPLALPAGSGPVTYYYTVWNIGGQQALVDVTVANDQCSPVAMLSGDLNGNNKLDPEEIWTYSCTTTLLNTATNTAIATGYGDGVNHEAAIDTAISTVVVGAPVPNLPDTGLLPPQIDIVKMPNRLTPFPFGGGVVTYTYTVTNRGLVAMHDVAVSDDKCRPVIGPSGDTNSDNLLDPGEAWMYTCQTHVSSSTRNVAMAEGKANGFTALGYAFATVLVASSGFSINYSIIVLAGILILLLLPLAITIRKHRISRKTT